MSRVITSIYFAVAEDSIETLEIRAAKAWEKFDQLDNQYWTEIGNRNLPETVTPIMVSQAEYDAIQAQKAYFRAYYEANECECRHGEGDCHVCRAYSKSKSEYREEI